MKKQFRRALSCVLILAMVMTFGIPSLAVGEAPTEADALRAEIEALYASEPGLVGRTHKMQAFIMELALHAKTRNPDFKIIPQDGINLAFVDGDWEKGLHPGMMALIDGWGIEGMVGSGDPDAEPSETQQKYMELVKAGKYVSDTTSVNTAEKLSNYYARAEKWGIIPYPRIGGELAEQLFPGWRWAANGDYFWVDDPTVIGLGDRVDPTRDVVKLTDAQNYLYNINGRPYDAWETWDDEEAAAVAEGEDGDRARIYDSYGCGLLVPSEGGQYQPVAGEDGDGADVAAVKALYGDEWDWWWRAAGLDESAGRETWLNALRNSDYDVIYIDTFYNHRARPENQTPLTREEVESLKTKPDGSRRQVIGYLSIGSAEQNRWYCQDDWVWVDPTNRNSTVSMKTGTATRSRQPDGSYVYSYSPYIPPEGEGPAPAWLSTGYGGNYPEEAVVQWWHPEWRDIIINGGGRYAHKTTGDNTSSIDRIINQGFDGVYLDNVGVYSRWQFDAYEQYWMNHGGIPGEVVTAELVDQGLDYTEDPVDVPNPDRGFYRANDGMVVPVSGDGGNKTMNVGARPVEVGGENGSEVQTRISHVYFDLRNFSSNAFTSRGTRYNSKYRAPAGVLIGNDRSTYMVEPDTGKYIYVYEVSPDTDVTIYESHFDYWQKEVLPTWPKGTSQPLTQDALDYIADKLQQVRDGEGVTLVRFNYDGGGYGWVDCDHPVDGYIDRPVADIEPAKETLLTHIAQLKPILHEYEDVIMAVDGGMFGPWGEMHSTTFGTSPEAYAWLLDAWLDAVPESRSIIVQGGAFLSWYNNRYGTDYTFENIDQIPAPERGTPEARFGFFNDSYAYGEDEGDNYPNDWGSLSEGAGWPGDPLGDEGSYDRGRVMTWIRKQNNFYGGEAQGDETRWNTYPFVAWEASYAQTVYLNADYEDSVHERWADFTYTEENVMQQMTNAYEEPYRTEYAIFDPVYDGRTGLEYWRDRLGYRLVLREADASGWVASNGTLEFSGKIQNVGFGNVVNQKDVAVILKNKASGKTYEVLTDLDARDWHPDLDSRATNTAAWRDLSFSISMDEFGQLLPGEYEIYLKINDPKEQSANKRCIRFANKAPEGVEIWNAELGANLIGSTLVLAADTSDIALAKAAVEGAAYTAKQSQAGTEAKALAKIREIIGKLDLKGASASVNKVSYTAAVAGTSGNHSGTNGSYVFTVSLEKDAASVVTRELTLTITATPYSGGSTGGSTSSAADPVTVSSSANGSVSVGSKVPQKGDTVVITASPDEGYAVASITVTDTDGKKLPVTDNGDGTYSFVYEGKPVTIKATFAPAAAAKLPFADVKSGDWFYDYVAYAYENKLMVGTADTRFSPDAELSRAMVATVLWRLAGEPTATASNPFSDLKEDWYRSAVVWAYEKGIVTGYGDGLFGPEDPVTREQLVAMIGRYAKEFKDADISASANLSGYEDINELSPYAYEYMSWACASGLIEGRSTSVLAPGGTATRAEFAAILYRFIEE